MPKRIRVLALLVVALVGAACCPSAAQEWRLGTKVRPLGQVVRLTVDPAADGFSGTTEIQLRVDAPVPAIRFHAVDITVTQAELVHDGQHVPLKVASAKYGILTASPDHALAPGRYALRLSFTGPYNRSSTGLYKYTDQGIPYLSTQFEMSDARRCFPCFDEPCFKIPYQLTIEAPKGLKVYSNAPEVKRVDTAATTVHVFAPTLPIPSYLVGLACGPFEQVPVKGMSVPGSIVAPKGKTSLAGYAQRVTPPILGYLERYFGTKYPYRILNQLAITEFPFGAMENPGMVTYREDTLLVNEATVLPRGRTEVVRTIAHELAHQWFGNQVTMKWWDDLWLNEAFATWMAEKVVSHLFPEFEVSLQTPQNDVMGADANLTTRPIHKQVRTDADIFDGLYLAYAKGSAVLDMIERWLGEETFKKGMRAYMAAHRFGNAEAADLWRALGAASHKDVEGVLASFTFQSGYPLITVALRGQTLQISQRRYTVAGVNAPAQVWKVPLRIRYGAGSRNAVASVLLTGKTTSVRLGFKPDWVFPDDGGVGYFRWQMPVAQIEALLGNRKRLTDREKIALLHNLDGLQGAGALSAGDGLVFAASFLSETRPQVASLALQMVVSRRLVFVNDANRELWKSFLESRLRPVRTRIGFAPRAGEPPNVKDLRDLVVDVYARDLEDPTLLGTAQAAAGRFIDASGPVDPAVIGSYLRIAARLGDVAMVERVKAALVAASDPQRHTTLLATLGFFATPQAQDRALDLILDDAITPSDVRILLSLNGDDEARRQRLQGWLMKNYPALRKKLPEAFLNESVACLAAARDADQLALIRTFFLAQPDSSGVLKREVAKLTETVTNTIAWRKRGQASFDERLRQAAASPSPSPTHPQNRK